MLRYWEEVIPFIRPRKDNQGRRFYSQRDLELITRVKYFLQERKYTLEGAGERLIDELAEPSGRKNSATLCLLRNELMSLYAIAQRWKNEG